jgi:hypothetical protein
MRVMPANSTGWFFHCLARETGKLGHLYSPGANRGPWPWFPYALDNGAFGCWDMQDNEFSDEKWSAMFPKWQALVYWAASAAQRPLWAIVPDVPGDKARTLDRYSMNVQTVIDAEIPPAIAVQDGMTPDDVRSLALRPQVVCIGGTTEWKWSTVEMWCKEFKRVHVLRCNSPEKLQYLEQLGAESCDGTGWNRGDKKQTAGLERWARKNPKPQLFSITPYTCRARRNGQLEWAF